MVYLLVCVTGSVVPVGIPVDDHAGNRVDVAVVLHVAVAHLHFVHIPAVVPVQFALDHGGAGRSLGQGDLFGLGLSDEVVLGGGLPLPFMEKSSHSRS